MLKSNAMTFRHQCTTCGARFFTKSLLNMHNENFHQKNKPIDNVNRRIRQIIPTENIETDATEEATYSEVTYVDEQTESTENAENTGEESVIEDENTVCVIENQINNEDAEEETQTYQIENAEGARIIYQTEDGQNVIELGEDEVIVGDNEEYSTLFVNKDGTMYMVQHGTETSEGTEMVEAQLVNMEDSEEAVVTEVAEESEEGSSERERKRLKIMESVNNIKYVNHADRNVPTFPCNQCEQVFLTKHERRLHLVTHARDARFFCRVCGRGFHKLALLKHHANVHVPGKQYQCPVCEKFYRSEVYLKKHIAMHEGKAPPRYECGVCGVQRALWHDLRRHMAEHARPQSPVVVKCSCCGIEMENGKGGSRARCPECSLKFRCMSTNRYNYGSPPPNGEGDRPYVCGEPGCLKSFRHPGHLRRHHATHVDDSMYLDHD